jgi:hypothetical protein
MWSARRAYLFSTKPETTPRRYADVTSPVHVLVVTAMARCLLKGNTVKDNAS